jgi:ribosomal protein S18 acetylase RimI-like enzyme
MIEPAGPLVHPVLRDANKIAAIVARAMLDDPLNDYYFLKHERREELGETLFRLLVAYGIRQGNLLATSARYEGIAYWQTPTDFAWLGAEAILWGGIRLLAKAGLPVIRRMYRASLFGYRLRKRLVPGPHWYLGLLAVAQEHRGKGHASALLRPVLEMAKREGLSCYLETHKQVNVLIYEHFGFRVVETVEVPESGVLQWCMVKKGG